MSISPRLLIVAFAISAFTSSDIAAGDGDKARTDLYGDALPRGAVARLGSVRFRFSDSGRPLAFSADGKKLLAGDWSGGLIVWDSATGERTRKFNLGSSPPGVAGFTPDGKVFALAKEPYPREIVFLLPESRSERVRLPWGNLSFQPLALSPGGKQMLVWAVNQVALWDFTAQEKVKVFPIKDVRKSPLLPLLPSFTDALSPESHIVAYANYKKDEICLFDLRSLKTIRKWDSIPCQNSQPHLTFSWDGKSLFQKP